MVVELSYNLIALCFTDIQIHYLYRNVLVMSSSLVWPTAGGPTASLSAEWPKASLLCGIHVTRVRIDGGVV